MTEHTSDYLLVGAGAMGMAFADVLMEESDATITIVDRYHQPGGHWNVAYPYVRLHQPSSFYGVNSRKLGRDRIDSFGWNKGLYELAGKSEICAYYDTLMHDFIASGRVHFMPMCEYQGDGVVQSLSSKVSHSVKANTVVDATFMNVKVPAMGGPAYPVADEITCLAPNELVNAKSQWQRYVIVGAGKTSMDACLFLLDQGVDPADICWIKPREAWLWDRAKAQSEAMFETSLRPFNVARIKVIAESESVDEVFEKSEAQGLFMRVDESIKPSMFRCATVSRSEVEALRKISNVVRLGRVKAITADTVELEQGEIPIAPDTLFVDCTADGLAKRPAQPVFAGNTITLQSVRTCQQVFSAAFIAHIALSERDEADKNVLCTPVPHPDKDVDYLSNTLSDLVNSVAWGQDPSLTAWVKASRLDGFSYHASGSAEEDAAFEAVMEQYGPIAAEKIMSYLSLGTGD
ncbi:MAG: NAD(P)/FAD-dependent oxidoreductase [Pseudomonadota bacterium]